MTTHTYTTFCNDVKQCIQIWQKKQATGHVQGTPMEVIEKVMRNHGGVAEGVALMIAAKMCEAEGGAVAALEAGCLGQAGIVFMEAELERHRLGIITMDQDLQRATSCIKRSLDIHLSLQHYSEAHSLALFAADSLHLLQCEDSAASFYIIAANSFSNKMPVRGDGSPVVDNQLREASLMRAFECQVASWNKSAALETAASLLELSQYQHSYNVDNSECDEPEQEDTGADNFFCDSFTPPSDVNGIAKLPDSQRQRITDILISVVLIHVACHDFEQAALLLPRLRLAGPLYHFIVTVVSSPRDPPNASILCNPLHLMLYQKVVTSVTYPSSYARDDTFLVGKNYEVNKMDTQTLTLTPTETGTRTLGTETLSLTLRTATETGTETLRTETLSLTLRTATETGTKTLRTGTATSTLGTRSATSSIVAETPSTTLTAATRTSTATLPTETATLYVTPTRVVVPTETPIVIQPSDDESFLNRWLIVLILGGLILIICILVLCVWKKSRNQKKKTRTPLPAHEPEDIPLVVDEGYERFGFEEKAQDSHMEMPYKPPELDKPPDTTLTPSEVSGKTENINNTKLATEKSASFFPSTGAHPTVIYGSPRVLSDDPGKASSSKAQSIHLSRYLKGLSSEGTPERPLTAWELPQTEAATYYSMPPSPYGRGRGALDPTFTHPSNNLHY